MNDRHETGRRPLPVLALVAVAGCSALVTGCSAGSGSGSGAAPTVTVTTTGTPSSTPTRSPTATSDVKGRRYDLGTIASVNKVGDTQVVELDRWTATGTSDSTLATQGLKLAAHKGSAFTNQNTTKTYTAPVAPGARLVLNTCVVDASGDLGMTSKPLSATSWLAKPDPAAVLLVTYDDTGTITRLDTDPRCPG